MVMRLEKFHFLCWQVANPLDTCFCVNCLNWPYFCCLIERFWWTGKHPTRPRRPRWSLPGLRRSRQRAQVLLARPGLLHLRQARRQHVRQRHQSLRLLAGPKKWFLNGQRWWRKVSVGLFLSINASLGFMLDKRKQASSVPACLAATFEPDC